jgi:plastocyanin
MPRTRPSLALALVALAVTGCGDAGPSVRERTGNFSVALDEYFMRPQEIRVPSGGRLTVTIVNRGRRSHTFRIRSADHNVLAEPSIKPGERRRRRGFRLAEGTYRMYCVLANHEELGMYGELTVG